MSARVLSTILLGTGIAVAAADAGAARTMIHNGYKYFCRSWCMIQPGTNHVVDAAGYPTSRQPISSTPPPDCNQVDCGTSH
jgi:hypothetical protein